MSATYRQAALNTPQKTEKDRDNALFSRGLSRSSAGC